MLKRANHWDNNRNSIGRCSFSIQVSRQWPFYQFLRGIWYKTMALKVCNRTKWSRIQTYCGSLSFWLGLFFRVGIMFVTIIIWNKMSNRKLEKLCACVHVCVGGLLCVSFLSDAKWFKFSISNKSMCDLILTVIIVSVMRFVGYHQSAHGWTSTALQHVCSKRQCDYANIASSKLDLMGFILHSTHTLAHMLTTRTVTRSPICCLFTFEYRFLV